MEQNELIVAQRKTALRLAREGRQQAKDREDRVRARSDVSSARARAAANRLAAQAADKQRKERAREERIAKRRQREAERLRLTAIHEQRAAERKIASSTRTRDRAVLSDYRYIVRIHRERNPELSLMASALDAVNYLRRAAGFSEEDELRKGILIPGTAQTAAEARYAAYWAYRDTDTQITEMTIHTIRAILHGHSDVRGKRAGILDPIPHTAHTPKGLPVNRLWPHLPPRIRSHLNAMIYQEIADEIEQSLPLQIPEE